MLLSDTIVSTKIELINDSPKIPPLNNKNIKYILVQNAAIVPTLAAIESGISYQPSIENNLNIEYIDSNGVAKYSGEIFLYIAHERFDMMNSMREKAIPTTVDALMARIEPFTIPDILGTNWNSKNNLKIRKIEIKPNDLTTGMPVYCNNAMLDVKITIKSNLFHPSDINLRNPDSFNLKINSIRKKSVNMLSA